jgi:hypothetical protein
MPAPAFRRLSARDLAPFANPLDYVNTELDFDLPMSSEDFVITWTVQHLHTATISVFSKVVAKISDNTKPGWAILAKKMAP